MSWYGQYPPDTLPASAAQMVAADAVSAAAKTRLANFGIIELRITHLLLNNDEMKTSQT
jgi:hypothetical protein